MVCKTVVVLGASYGGSHAAQILAQELPDSWRVVLVDRNSHYNHLYALPRFAVLPEHAHKAFIPYDNIFGGPSNGQAAEPATSSRQILLHAHVTSLQSHSLTLSRAFPQYGIEDDVPRLHFDYLVYALGSHLPAPINLWGPVGDEMAPLLDVGTKAGGIDWLKRFRSRIEQAGTVLVVGGGALGIQYATDIAEVFPTKSVTLLHSRDRLLPRFDENMHEEIVSALSSLNVTTVLGERLDLSSIGQTAKAKDGTMEGVVRTVSGREIRASIVLLCTGQTPNTAMLQAIMPDSVVSSGPSKGMVRVKRSMQIAVPRLSTKPESRFSDETVELLSRLSLTGSAIHAWETDAEVDDDDDAHLDVPCAHMFAIGDAADAFGAINAGHTAYYQGEIAARNIIKLIIASERKGDAGKEVSSDFELGRYVPGQPAIKISLGLTQSLYQVDGVVGKKMDAAEDLDAPLMWKFCGIEADEDGMFL